MPKRQPAILPPSDDSQFFTIVNPYPNQPHLSLEDTTTFARWIAGIVGEENLFAFYHKPKSPNVVIVEVSKGDFGVRRLVGEHRWSDFLRDQQGEVRQVSCIFPCTMTDPWSIEKIRWLRRDVESSWFRNWSPTTDSAIVYPYPESHYCRPPVEDVTRSSLCRPLRKDLFHGHEDNAHRILGVPAAAAVPYRSSSPFSDSSAFSSDEHPTVTRPRPRFVPAIHGSDIPKNVAIVETSASAAEGDAASLWSTYGKECADEKQAELCTAHGALCRSGICKICAQRKRAEMHQDRTRRRQEEREDWRRLPGRARRAVTATGTASSGDDHAPSRSTSGSHSASVTSFSSSSSGKSRGHLHPRTHDTAKGKPDSVRSSANHTSSPPTPNRPLPAHLRKGASASLRAVSVSSTSPLASSASAFLAAASPASISDSESSCASSVGDDTSPPSGPWLRPVKGTAPKKPTDGESVMNGLSSGAFENPWDPTRKPLMDPAPRRWADLFGDKARAKQACEAREREERAIEGDDNSVSL